ncbi:MAG TPA: DUF1775 domain-containing protein [Sporichthyaceae bacterium]|nr:DUF1775 domain-containing protein [Sporichthyaceae bacterium]
MPRTATRTFQAALGAAGTLLVCSAVASAHVTVTPGGVPAGQDTTLTFQVPDERSDVSTTGLRIVVADGAALRGVSVLPKPGWDFSTAPPSASSASIAPAPTAVPTSMPGMSGSMPGMSGSMPGMSGMSGMSGMARSGGSMSGMSGMSMPTDTSAPTAAPDGDSDDTGSAVGSITWTARESSAAIAPGTFGQFEILATVPADRASLVFAAVQTYSDGTVVRWIDRAAPGAPQPAHPAPVVMLLPPMPPGMPGMPGMPMPDPSASPGSSGNPNAMAGMSMPGMSGMAGMSMGPGMDMSAPKSDSVNVALAVGIAGLIASMMAAILAMNAMTRARRASRPAPPDDCH